VDVVEGETGVLEHADEHKSAEGLWAISALPRVTRVGAQQAPSLVVTNRRRGDIGPLGHLPNGQEFGHETT